MALNILAIGDTHARTKHLSDYSTLTKAILEQVDLIKPDMVVFLGDDLHNHSTAHSSQLNAVLHLLKQVAKRCKVVKLIGNHEVVSPNLYLSDNHHFKEISIPNLTIVDKPTVIDGLGFVPYICHGRFKEAISTIGNVQYLFAHQEFHGCVMNNTASTVEDEAPEGMVVISGHIHDPHEFKNVYYAGVPAPTTFAETSNPTIIHITNVITRVPLQGVVKYLTQKTTPLEFKDCIKGITKLLKNGSIDKFRVIVTGELSEIKTLRNSSTYKDAQELGIFLVTDAVVEDIQIRECRRRKTFSEIINEMLDENEMSIFNEIRAGI